MKKIKQRKTTLLLFLAVIFTAALLKLFLLGKSSQNQPKELPPHAEILTDSNTKKQSQLSEFLTDSSHKEASVSQKTLASNEKLSEKTIGDRIKITIQKIESLVTRKKEPNLAVNNHTVKPTPNDSKQSEDHIETPQAIVDDYSSAAIEFAENEMNRAGDEQDKYVPNNSLIKENTIKTQIVAVSTETTLENSGYEILQPSQGYTQQQEQIMKLHSLTPMEATRFIVSFNYLYNHFEVRLQQPSNQSKQSFEQWLESHRLTNLPNNYFKYINH